MFSISDRPLAAQKDRYLLYPKAPPGDLTHYNEIGAFFAYRELMRHINVYFPEIVPYTPDDINIEHDENGVASVTLKEEAAYKAFDESFFKGMNLSLLNSNGAFENTAANSLTVLFFRDSYTGDAPAGNFFSKYIARHFNKTILIHFENISNLKLCIDRFHPDMVVFESAERQAGWFFNCVNQLQL
jgi:hypothetical protein